MLGRSRRTTAEQRRDNMSTEYQDSSLRATVSDSPLAQISEDQVSCMNQKQPRASSETDTCRQQLLFVSFNIQRVRQTVIDRLSKA